MFRSQHSYFGSVTCPGLLQNKRCSLPHCIFSHKIDSKKRAAEESDLVETLAHKQSKNGSSGNAERSSIKQDMYNVKLSEPGVSVMEPKGSSSPLSSQGSESSLPTTSSGRGNKATTSVSNSTSQASINPQEPQSEKQKSLIGRKIVSPGSSLAPGQKASSPSITTPNSSLISSKQTGVAKAASTSISQRADATFLVPTPVQPFAPATHDQRISYLKFIVKELEAKKVRYPKRVAMKLEYNIARSSSKIIYPKNIRILVSDIQNNRFGKPGAEKAAAERQAKEAMLNAQLRNGLKDLLIPTRFLESNEYVVGMVIPKPIEDDFVATCERCNSKFKPNGSSAQSTCYYHWARLPYDCM